jgi:Spy/CpxP family protein refolding chaperone
MQNAMTELTGILTAEQKAKLEELRKDEGRKGRRHGRRFGGPDSNQSNNPPKP